MELVKNLISALCVSLIFFGVVMMLTPNGQTQKTFKTFISIALVATIISVIMGGASAINDVDFNFSTSMENTEQYDLKQTVEELNISATENAVKDLIFDELTKAGVNGAEISVKADISEDNSIEIIEAIIICEKDDVYKCKQVISKIGIEVTVKERENDGLG